MKRNSNRRKSFRELQFGAMQQINAGELASEPLPEPYDNPAGYISVGADAGPALMGKA